LASCEVESGNGEHRPSPPKRGAFGHPSLCLLPGIIAGRTVPDKGKYYDLHIKATNFF
jgi:hypothetical protein